MSVKAGRININGDDDPLSTSNSNPDLPPTSANNTRIAVAGDGSEESDEELFTVPDVEAQTTTTTSAALASNNPTNSASDHNNQHEKRRRGRNPVDKEHRRLKRLLRNRVSAQQARERKKVYVSDLESRAQELQDINAKLQENISTVVNENAMLRKVLMNTRPKVDEE